MPKVIVPRVTIAPLTVMPTGMLVTVAVVPAVVTEADAVILVAPAESKLAAFKVIVATPKGLPTVPSPVKAVAEVGVNTTIALAGAKVTTVFASSAPLAFLTVAEAVTGVPNVTELELTLNVRELKSVGVGVGVGVGVEPSPSGPVPHP